MHDGKDENAIALNAVEDAVGKPIRERATDVVIEDRPHSRVGKDVPDGVLDLECEVKTESRLAGLVILDGLPELALRLRVEREAHC